MRTSALMLGILGALGLTFVHNMIEQATGVSLRAVLWSAAVTLVCGLYVGLYTKNKNVSKESGES